MRNSAAGAHCGYVRVDQPQRRRPRTFCLIGIASPKSLAGPEGRDTMRRHSVKASTREWYLLDQDSVADDGRQVLLVLSDGLPSGGDHRPTE